MGFAAVEEDRGGVVLVKETEAYKKKKRASKHKKSTDKKKTKKARDPNKKKRDTKRSKPSTNQGPTNVPVELLAPGNRSSKTNVKEVKKIDAGKTPGNKTPAKEEVDPFEAEILKQKDEVRRKTDERMAILAGMPKSEDNKAPKSGDSKPARSGDVRMPRSGDSRPQRSGDVKPPRSGGVKAPRSTGLKPPRSGNVKPPRSGNTKLPRGGDRKPMKSGDRMLELSKPDLVRAKIPKKDRRRTTDKPSKHRRSKDRNGKNRKMKKPVTPRAITPLSDVKKVAEKVRGDKNEEQLKDIDAFFKDEAQKPKGLVDVVVSQEPLKKDEVVLGPSKEDPKESRELPSKEVVAAIPAETPKVVVAIPVETPKAAAVVPVETPKMENSEGLPIAPTQSAPTSKRQTEVPDATTPDIPMQKTQPLQQTPAAASMTALKSENGKTPVTAPSIPQLTNPEDIKGARQLQPSSDINQTNVVQPKVAMIGSKTDNRPASVPKPTPPGLMASSSPLVVNVDEVLRLGSVMERQGSISQPKKQAFEWMAMNRDRVDVKPKTFSTNLMTALGDVEVDRELAINAVSELRKAGTLTEDEFMTLMKTMQVLTAPITVGQVAYLVHTEVAYYKNQKIEDKE